MSQPTAIPYCPKPNWLSLFRQRLGRRNAGAVVLGGSVVLLLGTILVSLLNFSYNVAMARMLGPAAFGNISAAVTMLMLASAITLSFQMVCAKFVARNESLPAKAAVYGTLRRKAWAVSLLVGAALVLARNPIASYLNIPDARLIAVLAVGIAAYAPLGVRRGALQGLCSFGRVSGSFIIEALVRFGAGVLLVALGYGILGAVGAISAAVLAASTFPRMRRELHVRPAEGIPASFHEGVQAIVFFVGQVVINNIDILLVKHYFAADVAGLYAAVALVGRVLYFLSWSVVSAMFPVSAAARENDEDSDVILLPLLLVVGLSVLVVLVLNLFPHLVMSVIFGGRFSGGGPLLTLYAIATALYALGVVLMTYEMSRRIANTGWLQLLFSGLLVVAIGIFHHSLREVIVVQIVLMGILLVLVTLPFVRRYKHVFLRRQYEEDFARN